MRTEIYHCDKCKKETDKKDMDSVMIEFRGGYPGHSGLRSSMDICPLCSEKLGIIKRVVKGDQIVNETQEVKDRLFDIVVEIVQEVGNQIEY